MSAESLERELASLGVRGTIEELGSLAVLTLAEEQGVDDGMRAAIVQLATQHGFTHIALDLQGGAEDRAALHRD